MDQIYTVPAVISDSSESNSHIIDGFPVIWDGLTSHHNIKQDNESTGEALNALEECPSTDWVRFDALSESDPFNDLCIKPVKTGSYLVLAPEIDPTNTQDIATINAVTSVLASLNDEIIALGLVPLLSPSSHEVVFVLGEDTPDHLVPYFANAKNSEIQKYVVIPKSFFELSNENATKAEIAITEANNTWKFISALCEIKFADYNFAGINPKALTYFVTTAVAGYDIGIGQAESISPYIKGDKESSVIADLALIEWIMHQAGYSDSKVFLKDLLKYYERELDVTMQPTTQTIPSALGNILRNKRPKISTEINLENLRALFFAEFLSSNSYEEVGIYSQLFINDLMNKRIYEASFTSKGVQPLYIEGAGFHIVTVTMPEGEDYEATLSAVWSNQATVYEISPEAFVVSLPYDEGMGFVARVRKEEK